MAVASAQVMDGMTQDGLRRPKPEEPAKPTGPVDADADIFGDAGRDFVPELPAPRSAATNGALHRLLGKLPRQREICLTAAEYRRPVHLHCAGQGSWVERLMACL